MAGIQTSIQLQDNFTNVLYSIMSCVSMAVTSMNEMQQAVSADIDPSSLTAAQDMIAQTTAALDKMTAAARMVPDSVPAPAAPSANADPASPAVQWQSDNFEVFNSSGAERFQQELQSASAMLGQLSSTQDEIARNAYNCMIFPPEAFQDMNSLAVRIDGVRDRIRQISSNPVDTGADQASAEMEQLRIQLSQMTGQQNALNTAVQNMDVDAANSAYLQLSRSVGRTEQYIRDNAGAQDRFNQKIRDGTSESGRLVQGIKGAVAAYISIQSVGNVLDISDELTQTTARIDMMNDGLQSTGDLVNLVFASAQDARGSFADMASVIAKFGNNAGDAFGSSEEVVAFANLVQKQMTIAGASTQESSNAMLQLSQALGSGVLRGDELNSIFEQAPNLIRGIADYLDVPVGQIREMASEGQLSADVVKASVFAAADDINARFGAMPMTWGQLWQVFRNDAVMAFQPVLQRLNDMANSQQFQVFVDNAVNAMAVLADMVLGIFDVIGQAGAWVAGNWSVLGPVIMGIAAALAVYYGWQLLCAAATGIMTVAQGVFNAVMGANPVVRIILLVITLITVIMAVCSWIAKASGVAQTGFGVICGAVNVGIQFFRNLGLAVADIALGIGSAISALGYNIMAAFHNAIVSVQAWWYDLLSTSLTTIEAICAALNKLPFIEFDYSGITSKADEYASRSAELSADKRDYRDIGDAFSEGMSTFSVFEDGWVQDAFAAGAVWGDGVADRVSGIFSSGTESREEKDPFGDIYSGLDSANDNLAGIAGTTGDIKDAVDIAEEDLKYLHDLAEQEAVNRFTTAEIRLDMTNNNSISSGTDLDGIISGLTEMSIEALQLVQEGV